MNIELAQLFLDFIPSEYTYQGQINMLKHNAAIFRHKNNNSAAIYLEWWCLQRRISLKQIDYYLGAHLHRNYKEGPATLRFDEFGNLRGVSYYWYGSLYRPEEEGPAQAVFSETGKSIFQTFIPKKL